MSYAGMLKHRCSLQTLSSTFVDGVPRTAWVDVATSVPCFLDLDYLRRGKDPMWTPETGRARDRAGVLFLKGTAPVKSGQRIVMSKGPSGTFLIEGAVDEAWRPSSKHHIEVGVTEVPTQITKGQGGK